MGHIWVVALWTYSRHQTSGNIIYYISNSSTAAAALQAVTIQIVASSASSGDSVTIRNVTTATFAKAGSDDLTGRE